MMSLTRFRGIRSAAALALGLTFAGPSVARADDWSLTRTQSDPALVSQRFSKLQRSPFDSAQWNALRKAIGSEALGKKIRAALKASPNSLSLRILDARADLAEGKATAAATKLAAIEPSAGRLAGQTFELRTAALESADDWPTLVALVEGRGQDASGAARLKLLTRAYEYAERGHLSEDALRLAQRLAALDPSSRTSGVRLARAARDAKQGKLADRAYADAIDNAHGSARDDLVAERARARLEADNAAGASELLWGLLDTPSHGSRSARVLWWEALGQAHRADRSTDILIARLTRWLKTNDDEAAGWTTLASAQESAGVDAVQSWRKVLSLSPRDEEASVAIVEALEARGDRSEAVAVYRGLLNRGSPDLQLGLDLAARISAAGDEQLAAELVAEIEAKAGRRSPALTLLLDHYNLEGESAKALEVARRLVKANGRKVEARIALGEQLYQMGRVPEAMAQWKLLPTLIRPAHKGHARHAEILSEHGRTAEAVLSLKQALKIAPKEPSYLRLRAVLAEEQRRPTQALALWEEVRTIASTPAHRILRDEARTRVVELLVEGAIPKRRYQLDRAMIDAQAALDKGVPLDEALEAGRFLAELQTRQENYAGAVGTQQAMLTLVQGAPDRLEQLAAAQRRAGQVESALGTLEELLAAEPSRTPDVLAEMSELAFEAGDEERALKTATSAAKRDHTQIEALVRLGELHEARGDTDEAARAYQRALDTTPGDIRARLRLAELEVTRGNEKASVKLLHAILEEQGPPELMRQAGRRALDIAEASGELDKLLALAVGRTERHPEADEPRQFLLETLDRVERADVEEWLGEAASGAAAQKRGAALRAPLVASLTRGSIGARLRAAEHLGKLGLPETAVPLANLGATLVAPSDATPTVRAAFERTRLTALRAAGALRDDAATDIFASLMASPQHQSNTTRQVVAWSLAQSSSPRAAEVLAKYLRAGGDAQISALACLAISAQPRESIDADLRVQVRQVSHEASDLTVVHACTYADAALTSDADLGRLRDQLRSQSPTIAAVAAWRLGQSARPSEETMEALFTRVIAPHGLAKTAASAAIVALVAPKKARKRTEAALVPPEPPEGAWATAIERWLEGRIAPTFEPLTPSDLADHRAALAAALGHANAGTRAERDAARKITEGCEDHPPGEAVCLAPLVAGAVRVAN